jgi:hypothetical protein
VAFAEFLAIWGEHDKATPDESTPSYHFQRRFARRGNWVETKQKLFNAEVAESAEK